MCFNTRSMTTDNTQVPQITINRAEVQHCKQRSLEVLDRDGKQRLAAIESALHHELRRVNLQAEAELAAFESEISQAREMTLLNLGNQLRQQTIQIELGIEEQLSELEKTTMKLSTYAKYQKLNKEYQDICEKSQRENQPVIHFEFVGVVPTLLASQG